MLWYLYRQPCSEWTQTNLLDTEKGKYELTSLTNIIRGITIHTASEKAEQRRLFLSLTVWMCWMWLQHLWLTGGCAKSRSLRVHGCMSLLRWQHSALVMILCIYWGTNCTQIFVHCSTPKYGLFTPTERVETEDGQESQLLEMTDQSQALWSASSLCLIRRFWRCMSGRRDAET